MEIQVQVAKKEKWDTVKNLLWVWSQQRKATSDEREDTLKKESPTSLLWQYYPRVFLVGEKRGNCLKTVRKISRGVGDLDE